ncbi:ABC transporter ATP-binding protein [Aureimonas jatrophae]|jgi:peptide/nickel transport system ATP-binding protein|uniref:Oligopeptide/dipeptide ABC transporter, ATP-binding protein, C-terminal domain-containing protein n=1 Tax=Aureimonas jatrophae TaxID=1166073 RepID=A0A1H0N9E0_9HYPH|nr:ABC transporter ATP-binding protein [Aureimonas jatrophae]MBB3951621.1 oligopeptide/dipeptide ABC transporter ATP-binding protein [Aureimonas jatrophae]SDO89136.1 oligopeptide/dipeptide ABC transporter, ATP-binding protein, C-terminal domain-containing protein [Aureimonas jatrophae]
MTMLANHETADPGPSATAEPVLRLRDLRLRFGHGGADLVAGVSLTVGRGETLCVVGESGCGKSVTALALMGLLPTPPARITGGEAIFEGRDLFQLTERERADLRGSAMGMIFQEPMTSLNPAFTVGQQIAEGVMRHRQVSKAQARAIALDILKRVRIPAPEKRLDSYPHQLSGGMRQRVMIAMALVNQPRLLIADEPTTALDVTIQAQVLALIAQLQRETGTAMILITHDLGVVAEVATHVAVMYAGRVVEAGPVEAIFTDPQHPYTIGLMGAMPSLGARQGSLSTIPGTVPPADDMPDGCRFAPRCPFAQDNCRAEDPPLREVAAHHSAACWYAPLEEKLPASDTRRAAA